MTEVRPARPEDAAELVRLRRVMLTAMNGEDRRGPWEAATERLLRDGLSEPPHTARFGVFVVDAGSGGPGGPLAACAVGTVEQRLPSPGSSSGLCGFVFNVCTDPAHRRRGHARAATGALLEWLASRGVTRVDLHATPQAERLYRSMGFTQHSAPLSLDVRG